MKKFLLLLILPVSVLASVVVLFDPSTGRITQQINSADTLQYLGNSNALINPSIPTNRLDLCKVTNGIIVLKSEAELTAEFVASSNAVVAAQAANTSNTIRTASLYTTLTNAEGRILKAFALLTLDQINTLRKLHSLPVITTNTFINALSNAVVNP